MQFLTSLSPSSSEELEEAAGRAGVFLEAVAAAAAGGAVAFSGAAAGRAGVFLEAVAVAAAGRPSVPAPPSPARSREHVRDQTDD